MRGLWCLKGTMTYEESVVYKKVMVMNKDLV